MSIIEDRLDELERWRTNHEIELENIEQELNVLKIADDNIDISLKNHLEEAEPSKIDDELHTYTPTEDKECKHGLSEGRQDGVYCVLCKKNLSYPSLPSADKDYSKMAEKIADWLRDKTPISIDRCNILRKDKDFATFLSQLNK